SAGLVGYCSFDGSFVSGLGIEQQGSSEKKRDQNNDARCQLAGHSCPPKMKFGAFALLNQALKLRWGSALRGRAQDEQLASLPSKESIKVKEMVKIDRGGGKLSRNQKDQMLDDVNEMDFVDGASHKHVKRSGLTGALTCTKSCGQLDA